MDIVDFSAFILDFCTFSVQIDDSNDSRSFTSSKGQYHEIFDPPFFVKLYPWVP
jgi:hypothetical protein